MQQFDANKLAQELGWAILKRLAAETRVQELEAEVRAFKNVLGGEADGQDIQGEGHQAT